MLNYQLIETSSDIDRVIPFLMENPILALDTETTNLNPLNGKLRLIQFKTFKGDIYIIDCFAFDYRYLGDKLKPVFENKETKIVIQNALFEYKWIYHYLKVRLNNVFDTYLASVLIDFHSDHDLGFLIEKYLNITIDKDEQRSNWAGILTQSQLNYAANDVQYLIPLREKLIEKLKETNQLKATKLEFDCIPAVADMELTGLPVDKDKIPGLISKLQSDREIRGKALTEWFRTNGGKDKEYEVCYQEDLFGNRVEIRDERDVNIKSPKQLLAKLEEFGIGVENTNSKTLGAAKGKYPDLKLLLDYREAEKLYSTYGEEFFKKHINPISNRIHSSMKQFGAQTARFTSNDPNLQNQVKEPWFRIVYGLTDPTRKLIIGDYSGYELRALADMAQDKIMLKAFEDGIDLHTLTASLAFNLPYDDINLKYPEKRYAAKQLNFSLIYGISPKGLILRFKNDGLDLTEEEAKAMIDAWYKAYPEAAQWLWNRERVIIKDKGQIRGVGGHLMILDFDPNDRISLSSAQRASRNYKVQNNNACATKRSLKILHDKLIDNYPNTHIINTVHDEIILETDEKDSLEVKELLVQSMIQGAREFLSTVKIEVSAGIGNSWADKK